MSKSTGIFAATVAVVLTGAFGADVVDRQTDKPDAPIGAQRTPPPPNIRQIAPTISLTPIVPAPPPDPPVITTPIPPEAPPQVTPTPPEKPVHARPRRRVN